MRSIRSFLVMALAVLAAGCAGTQTDDARFGDSVRQMIEDQTYQPGDHVPPTRGDQASGAMKRYRGQGSATGGGMQ
ncbi:hypothetical protein [Arhodomonas sp. AD133]|uniref:hypothetical protein n=1 Tax=Arhodomonas sp. AD133 TaxID=3415009 RepID=UPI003EB7ED82